MDASMIEETNKVRAKLGLPLLPVPGQDGPSFKQAEETPAEEAGSTLESRQAQGYDNWKQVQEEAERKKKSQARNDAIKKARDVAQKHARLEGKGLGEASDEELDTRSWLKQQKKRQKKLDKEREKMRRTEEEQRAREQAEYTSKDLAGVKVAHEIGDFDMDTGDQVLTLKDATIDENEEEGDELENIGLREKEKLDERLSLKKKKPVYNPNDFGDETGEKTVLAQYDEVIDGKKRKRFTLDAEGSTIEERNAQKQSIGEKLNTTSFSLDSIPDLPISDYQEAKEVSFKKPKKKKTKSTRKKMADDDDILPIAETNADAMDVDVEAKLPTKHINTLFIDDDDLQASLAKQRREALKKRKAIKPEDIARRIRDEGSATPAAEENEEEDGGGLVINEATQFLANIQRPEERPSRKSPPASTNGAPQTATAEDGSGSESDQDVDMDRDAEREDPTAQSSAPDLTATGLEEESSLNQGIGNTLNLLRQRGLMEEQSSEDLNALHRQRQRFLQEKQRREEAVELKARQQRERDRNSGKYERMSVKEREEYARWENRNRDQQESRLAAEIFNREYKPDIVIRHVDDHGRELNQKEAFKHMSHHFHGKFSGKKKTEKHLKKIDDEKERAAQSVLDAGHRAGLNSALGATAKKNKQAGVRLA